MKMKNIMTQKLKKLGQKEWTQAKKKKKNQCPLTWKLVWLNPGGLVLEQTCTKWRCPTSFAIAEGSHS